LKAIIKVLEQKYCENTGLLDRKVFVEEIKDIVGDKITEEV
jgi:hypothetical protein